MAFSENLQFLRTRQGQTQEQLAELLEVSRQSVSKWESAQSFPEMDTILRICDLYQVDLKGPAAARTKAAYAFHHLVGGGKHAPEGPSGNRAYQGYPREQRLSQEELAARVGVSRQAVSKWELGETSPDILRSTSRGWHFPQPLVAKA